MKKYALLFACLFAFLPHAQAQLDQLMPVPQSVKATEGKFRLDSSFTVYLRRIQNTRIDARIDHFLRRLDGRTGQLFPKTFTDLRFPGNGLNIAVGRKGRLEVREDEAYTLEVTPRRIMLRSETDLGAMHGLETLLQLVSTDSAGYYFPACTIEDAPRFPWRGLLLDACRHFMPVDVVKRNLDGMAAMKMNVFHWHLSENQGFRVESKRFPKLHELGSNGDFYTQEQIKDVIAYADARGIRVVPEFDMPGHGTAWFVGHPELASAPGPYEIEKGFGVFKPAMDPTKPSTYRFLEAFLGEMCVLFPDAYFHIGGDEVVHDHWDNNAEIQAFMKEKGMKDVHDLQLYFNQRILDMLTENGKKMVGWDEILEKRLPKDAVIQSWRGKEGLAKAAKGGYDVLLSNGYYIDLCKPASAHYVNDPLPADLGLKEKEAAHVLGGEATMWAELVSPETVDSRIWPRTAAIAERLWSAGSVNDVTDMYRRLDLVSIQLEELGLLHRRNQLPMMRRLCRGEETLPLETLVQVVEPLPIYNRHHQGVAYSTDLPLTRLPDIAVPDPEIPRVFSQLVDQYLENPGFLESALLKGWFSTWINNHPRFQQLAHAAPVLRDALPLSASLADLGELGLEILAAHRDGKPILAKKPGYLERIEAAAKPAMETRIAVIPAFKKLLEGK